MYPVGSKAVLITKEVIVQLPLAELMPTYIAPFKVLEPVGNVARRIKLTSIKLASMLYTTYAAFLEDGSRRPQDGSR